MELLTVYKKGSDVPEYLSIDFLVEKCKEVKSNYDVHTKLGIYLVAHKYEVTKKEFGKAVKHVRLKLLADS